MRRRKVSLWGSKKASKASSTRKQPAARGRPEPTEVPVDWGQFYDKLSTRDNSRGHGGQCVDDLVLLEDVSNEGIVEVSEVPACVGES